MNTFAPQPIVDNLAKIFGIQLVQHKIYPPDNNISK